MLGRWKIARNIAFIYPSGEKVFLIRTSRKGRKWNILSRETVPLENNDNWPDTVVKIAAGIPDTKRTVLVLVIPRSDYFFTRGVYPVHLGENIGNILAYEQDEHVFLKEGCSILLGNAVETPSSLIATIYWVKNSVWENFWQTGIAKLFEGFLVIPDIAVLSRGILSFLPFQTQETIDGAIWAIFSAGKDQIHAFHTTGEGSITESVLFSPEKSLLKKFLRKKLEVSSIILCSDSASENLIKDTLPDHISDNTKSEKVETFSASGENIPSDRIKPKYLYFPFEEAIHRGILKLLESSVIQGFNNKIRVNLSRIPIWVYTLLVVFLCYTMFAGYTLFEDKRLTAKLARIKKERALLEEQWKPIEQQMKAVEQMEQDKKTLESITAQTIPLREFMEVLSVSTPRDTWINNLILTQGNKVILRGDSKSAVQYVGELSKISGFKDVKFVSPVRKDATSDKEFFNIEITVDWNEFKKARTK